MQKGTLKIREVKKGSEYSVEFESAKGKMLKMVIQPADRLFDIAKVVDGDSVEFELDKGRPVKCVVPGKEGQPQTVQKNAVAPYNFIPFESGAVIPAFEDEEGIWSGKIVCSMTALTPLLVSGRQEKANANSSSECRFMCIDGHNILPGTSIKGMLRSLLKILSFSNMLPLADKPLFWRRVNRPDYRGLFSSEKVLGGYMRKEGASYVLIPVQVTPQAPDASPLPGCERVKTGGFFNPKTKVRSKDYYFHFPKENAEAIPLESEVVSNFWAQLTPNQEKRWDKDTRSKRLGSAPGLPVFYRQDEDGNITDLGFCRYFRLKYQYTPYNLVYPSDKPIQQDFVTRLFGSVGKESLKGRVSVSPARVEGALFREQDLDVVLGTPKPTCLPLYLEQDATKVQTMSSGNKNDPDSMRSYNDSSARLRGYKWYWHHDVDKKFFSGTDAGRVNDKVSSRLYPVAENSKATIVIHVDRLTDTELGGLLEAIELPEGHAHKLGMGKSLGLGSVRLHIEDAHIVDIRNVHRSLTERLENRGVASMDEEKRLQFRNHFRVRILEAVRMRHQAWKHITDYDQLPPIWALRIMMDYVHRPEAEKVRTMKLKEDSTDPLTMVNFGVNAILPGPEQVVKK